jgi:polyisoprenoid-binding protein YceI
MKKIFSHNSVLKIFKNYIMITNWKVDHDHSEVMFKAKYLMITEITGYISSFNLDFKTAGNDFSEITGVVFSADVNTLNTNNKKRDEHLMSVDFFDAGNHDRIRFTGNKFVQLGKHPRSLLSVYRNDYELYGDLTIKGIKLPVKLNGYFKGTAIDAIEQKKAGFSFSVKISRSDFNMNWKKITKAGKLLLGDEIEIFGNIQLVRESQEVFAAAAMI